MAHPPQPITINYQAGNFTFSPIGKVFHKQEIIWSCQTYNWRVFFKAKGSPLRWNKSPHGDAGTPDSGVIKMATKAKDKYPWGAEVEVTPGNWVRSQDPDIIIDDNPDQPFHQRGRKWRKLAKKRSGKRKSR